MTQNEERAPVIGVTDVPGPTGRMVEPDPERSGDFTRPPSATVRSADGSLRHDVGDPGIVTLPPIPTADDPGLYEHEARVQGFRDAQTRHENRRRATLRGTDAAPDELSDRLDDAYDAGAAEFERARQREAPHPGGFAAVQSRQLQTSQSKTVVPEEPEDGAGNGGGEVRTETGSAGARRELTVVEMREQIRGANRGMLDRIEDYEKNERGGQAPRKGVVEAIEARRAALDEEEKSASGDGASGSDGAASSSEPGTTSTATAPAREAEAGSTGAAGDESQGDSSQTS